MAETKTCTGSWKTSMVSQGRSGGREESLSLKLRSQEPEIRTVKESEGKIALSPGKGVEDIQGIKVMTTGIRMVLRDDGKNLPDTLTIQENPEITTGGEKSPQQDKNNPNDIRTGLTLTSDVFSTLMVL